jgi:aldose 1-epimerase
MICAGRPKAGKARSLIGGIVICERAELPLSANTSNAPLIGGADPVFLRRTPARVLEKPEFVEAVFLPGRGMNFFQARAVFLWSGEINLLASPSLAEAAHQLDGGNDDFMGVRSFSFGGAVLLPFANRVRGRLQPDGRIIETDIPGRVARLPADWSGKNPDAEKCAIHGLVLAAKFDVVEATPARVKASLQGQDFGGYWASKIDVLVEAELSARAVDFAVRVTNAGQEPLPVGIGWHPYFALPSGERRQARLRVPGRQRVLVNNYDDVFPTGKLTPVAGSQYDFRAPGGTSLGDLYLDDCFADLDKTSSGHTVIDILDPAAGHGVRITALSPQVKAVQVFAPREKNYVAVEPQFNLADPYSPLWPPGTDTGMVTLASGEATLWQVRLELLKT